MKCVYLANVPITGTTSSSKAFKMEVHSFCLDSSFNTCRYSFNLGISDMDQMNFLDSSALLESDCTRMDGFDLNELFRRKTQIPFANLQLLVHFGHKFSGLEKVLGSPR